MSNKTRKVNSRFGRVAVALAELQLEMRPIIVVPDAALFGSDSVYCRIQKVVEEFVDAVVVTARGVDSQIGLWMDGDLPTADQAAFTEKVVDSFLFMLDDNRIAKYLEPSFARYLSVYLCHYVPEGRSVMNYASVSYALGQCISLQKYAPETGMFRTWNDCYRAREGSLS
jgi:hypothetical protein